MKEIFLPRENMKETHRDFWECRDENGKLVCDGGPSIIHGNYWEFYLEGIGLHRLDGPTNAWGEFWISGKRIKKDEIYTFAKENDIDLENLSDEDKVLIILRFG